MRLGVYMMSAIFAKRHCATMDDIRNGQCSIAWNNDEAYMRK
jgi:hypothetical protein